jgi:cell division protein FtsL
MARLNLALLAVLAACSIGLVTSQHQARKLFVELEREQARTKALDIEWGQLQIEASTWAALGRVEKIATERLRMRAPDPQRVRALEAQANAAGGKR